VQAQQRIDALNQRNLERFPKYRKLLEEARFGTRVQGLQDSMVEDVRPTLYLLQAVVAFVLLIGCVNVANLMLVRSNVRMKELAVRFSLGASRGRLGRQFLTESVLLALVGGALGIVTGFWGVRLLNLLGAEELPRGSTIHPDGMVLGFALLVAVAAGLFFGSIPVVHLFRRNLNDVFRQSERAGTAERRALRTRAVMVICQVSLAFVLLIGAGLMTLSFVRALRVDPGFLTEGVTTARLSLPQARYAQDAQARNFTERLLAGVRSLPGVSRAGITSFLPFGGNYNASAIMIEGYSRAPGEPVPVPGYNTADADYFSAMGIPLLRGRLFQETDTAEALRVVVIDQFLARRYWPDKDPIGGKIRRGVDSGDPAFTVIGVVGSVKVSELTEQNPVGLVYFHYKQVPPRGMHLAVKTARDGEPVLGAVRREAARLDSELPLYDVKTMDERLERSLLARRASMVLCLVFAGLALLLAAIGIYGVLAYAVTQRTREFGVRIALGARAADVLGMVFRQGLTLALVGVVIGVAGAYFLSRLMTSLLFEVKPADPGVFVLAALLLSAAAAMASLAPSLRATTIDPVITLRYE
jgi:predicted permease